ncbi:MAG: alpha/beta hydrolase [Betaproteobacteria bacterium]|nr:alpha/beta hydrolase [Betaproteobacteria bacterium]
MPYLNIHGANIFHEVFGDSGPWLALNSGGRHRYLEMAPLAQAVAAKGFRVLVHDRRNTGASDIIIGGEGSEEDIWADDLHALLQHHGAERAFLGGSSAGARLSMTVQRRHPEFVLGLLLMRVTGGAFAAGRLPNTYYGQYIKAAHAGGMVGVCDTEPYRERLALNPSSRDRLMAMDPRDYMAVMGRWLANFTSGPVGPVMGVPEDELKSYRVPTLVVPGNDKTHSSVNGLAAAALIPGAELFQLPIEDQDVDLIAFPDWKPHYPALADKFAEFMRRHALG